MAKNSKTSFIKFHRKKKYIKDKAIIKFILQHETKISIDFSKIKIPPLFKCLKNDDFIDTTQTYKVNDVFNLTEPLINDNSISLDDKSDLENVLTLSTETF